VGWTKARELAKVARREGERFESAPWVHKAQALPKEEFKREVERHLTGKETEAWEIVYFKFCKSQLPVVEKALEMVGLMLGRKSRGYCLEMICADFLAGGNVRDGGVYRRKNAAPSPEASPVEAPRRRMRFTSSPSAPARRVAMSKLWFDERLAHASYREAEQAR
jgi:hypothetical protein